MRFPLGTTLLTTASALVLLTAVPALAQQPAKEETQSVRERENEIGRQIEVTPDQLAKPYATQAYDNAPAIVPRNARVPQVPEGFQATLFAEGLENPRQATVLPNGDVIVALQKSGIVMLMRDDNGDGRADYIQNLAGGFNQPYGVAYREGEVLTADQDGIWVTTLQKGAVRGGHGEAKPLDQLSEEQRKPKAGAPGSKMLTEKGVFGEPLGHRNRDLEIGPDGQLYVGVGSAGNIGIEPEPKATIQRFSASGQNQKTIATGVRNPTGLAFHPDTGALWAAVQERDNMGDRLVPDYLAEIEEGDFYGWPHSYIGDNPQPEFAKVKPATGSAPDAREVKMPPLLFESHSAVMDLVFYEGDMFPEEYQGDAIVALKGSWNRSEPTGYKIVRVPFEDGKPTGGYENFITGFWVAGDDKAQVWGRPADVALAPDGALYIVDDTGGTIWRVTRSRTQKEASADKAD